MRIISFITEAAVVRDILIHFGSRSRYPPLRRPVARRCGRCRKQGFARSIHRPSRRRTRVGPAPHLVAKTADRVAGAPEFRHLGGQAFLRFLQPAR